MNEDLALKTLFYGLQDYGVDASAPILFINARQHGDLNTYENMDCVQWFKPYATRLRQSIGLIEDIEEIDDTDNDQAGAKSERKYKALFLLWPKNHAEGEYLLAKGLHKLDAGGRVFIAADNKAGGSRLHKIVQQFNLENPQQISKHKCRFITADYTGHSDEDLQKYIAAGAIQAFEKTGFITQSGIYGAQKIDTGSRVLLQHIPDGLKGSIADFGCGYGYLLQHILQQNNAGNNTLKRVYAIDADARALECAKQNLSSFGVTEKSHDEETDPAIKSQGDSVNMHYLWADLTQASGIPAQLDTIIMNPPFHEGKTTNSDIGVNFIKTAAACLKRKGVLYMVANNHLPYEPIIAAHFFEHEILATQNGFKVIKAAK